MVYIQVINDIHLSDRAPINCTDSYTDDLFELLGQTVEVAKKFDAYTVFAGDVFHLKQPSRNSHALVQRMIDLIKQYPNLVYIVPGNHDLLNDRLDSIPSQPLGVLLKSGAHQLKDWDDTIGLPIYGVPWLQRFTDHTVAESFKEYRERYQEFEQVLTVTHAPLYPLGKELKYEFYPSELWAEAMCNTGHVAYGHIHDYHGVWESGGVQFCNNGALSRGSLTEHNRTRKIYTTIWSSINGSFRAVELKHKKAEEVFKIDQADRKKEAQLKLDDFLTAIGETTIEITSVDAVLNHVISLGIDANLVSIVKELLEEVTEQ